MSVTGQRTVLKMNGLGNEIVVLDLRDVDHRLSGAEARAIARSPGLQFDQLMVLSAPQGRDTEAFVRIYNTDGSEAEACGNGTRCVAWALSRAGAPDRVFIETVAGRLACDRLGPELFAVDMGPPVLDWASIPLAGEPGDTVAVPIDTRDLAAALPADFAAVNMGNPHAVFFVTDVEAHDLARVGPRLETHPLFPVRANVSLAALAGPDRLRLKVWERGVGLTRACGSAACAAAVAAHRRGLVGRDVAVALPGGTLTIEWRADGRVIMTGPVEFEFEVALDPAILGPRAA